MTLFYYFWRKSKGWSCNMFILRFKLQKCTFVTKTQSRCFLMIRTEHSAVYSCCAHFEQNINTLWVSKYGQKVLQQCSKVWDKMLPWNSLVTWKCAWCLIITKEAVPLFPYDTNRTRGAVYSCCAHFEQNIQSRKKTLPGLWNHLTLSCLVVPDMRSDLNFNEHNEIKCILLIAFVIYYENK